METTSSRSKSNVSGFSHHFQRSISPSDRFCSSSISSPSSSFATRSGSFLGRATSPTRVNLRRSVSPSSSVRFSTSPSRSIAVTPSPQKQNNHSHSHRHRHFPSNQKKTCMCSPTTHPGSFRCSLHKGMHYQSHQQTQYHSSHHLNMRRSAMKNSLVRIGTVEGDLVKRALAALIRPSSHSLRRRVDFQPRPSRLSIMSKAED